MPQLTWLGDAQAKHAARRVPYRLLDTVQHVGDPAAGNWLIQGDNLDALKALLPFYAGRVKCIFIDPPYNTKSAFEHYDDNLEHSQWLSMMYPRLELLRELLAEDGSIWVTIDDNEAHYLKVLLDEVLHRKNFISSFAWEKDQGRRGDTDISSAHDHVLAYAKNRDVWRKIRNLLPRTDAHNARYRNPDNDPRGPWLQGDNGTAKSGSEGLRYPITTPAGRVVVPPKGNYWRFSKENFQNALAEGRVYFGADGNRLPVIKRYLTEVQDGVVPRTWWPAEMAGTNQSAKRDHLRKLLPEIEPFATPKPEQLIHLITHIATNPGDIVLDSFLGSGTTAAVAHKMNRRWIGIEMGAHAQTHCLPRLQKVIEGEQGGISESVGWQGGGGFRFLRLGEAAFLDDGRINPAVRFATLAGYLWFLETGEPHASGEFNSPLLGVRGVGEAATALILLYNGILGDRRPQGGNVLTLDVWQHLQSLLPEHRGRWLVYGEAARMPEARRRAAGIEFRQIPYDVRMR